jgi:hypothetical protein
MGNVNNFIEKGKCIERFLIKQKKNIGTSFITTTKIINCKQKQIFFHLQIQINYPYVYTLISTLFFFNINVNNIFFIHLLIITIDIVFFLHLFSILSISNRFIYRFIHKRFYFTSNIFWFR